jgi:hypothetical protein
MVYYPCEPQRDRNTELTETKEPFKHPKSK